LYSENTISLLHNMNLKIFLALLMVITALGSSLFAQTPTYQPSVFISKKDTLPYRILYPENFVHTQKYPLLLVLHGAGERGNDNEQQLLHGSSLFLTPEARRRFPAIVVFPQCPQDSYWANVLIDRENMPLELDFKSSREKPTKAMELLQGLVEELSTLSFVDTQRMYVGGISMGAMGTFELLRREPKRFAAAFAICGGDAPENAKEYASVPIWIFHGEQDSVVPVRYSKEIAKALEAAGANVRLTLYPRVDHDSWVKAFKEPELLSWLSSKKKDRRRQSQ
jgi:predicted peptidase